MRFQQVNGLLIGRFGRLLEFKDVLFGFSTRIGGASNPPFDSLNLGLDCGDERDRVLENRRRFFQALGIRQEQLAVPGQVHGSRVEVASKPGLFPSTDALVTNRPGVFLSLSVADCLPIFYFDPFRRVVGAVHAGWRGTSQKIAVRTLEKMSEEFGCQPSQILVFVGPHIGPCCYEVGEEVAQLFEEDFLKPRGDGRWALDLWAVNERQLISSGILQERMTNPGLCTSCHRDLFFSHRGEGGRTGRMLGVIGIRAFFT